MHENRFGEADRLAREPLDARAQRQMLPFNLLRIAFTRDMRFGGQMPGVRSPVISEEACDAKGFEQGFELQEHFVLVAAKHLGQDLSSPVIDGIPQPAGFLLLAYRAPHFINLRGVHPVDANSDVADV